MDTGKAIFFGLALIALAIFATDAMRPAWAGAGQAGSYNISDVAKTNGDAWIINTSTGHYRRCDRDGDCGPWRNSQ